MEKQPNNGWEFKLKPATFPNGYSETVLVACVAINSDARFVTTDRWNSDRQEWEKFDGDPISIMAWKKTPDFPCTESLEAECFLSVGPTTSGKISIGFDGDGMPFKRCSIEEARKVVLLIQSSILQASKIKA